MLWVCSAGFEGVEEGARLRCAGACRCEMEQVG